MKNWNCEPRKQVSETKTCQSVHWVVYLNLKMAVVIGEACQVQILVLSDHGYFKSSLTVGVFVGLLSSCKSKKMTMLLVTTGPSVLLCGMSFFVVIGGSWGLSLLVLCGV